VVDVVECDEFCCEYDVLCEDGFVVEWVDELPVRFVVLYDGVILYFGDGVI